MIPPQPEPYWCDICHQVQGNQWLDWYWACAACARAYMALLAREATR